MSGIASGKSPQTDAQWARDVQQTLDGLANPKTQRVGDWVFSQTSEGALQATKPGATAATIIDPDGNLVSAPSSSQIAIVQKQVTTSAAAFATFLSAAGATLSDPTIPFSTKLSQLDAEWNTFITAEENVDAEGSLSITQLLDSLFNIDPTTGLTSQNQIDGLQDLFNQLSAAVNGDIANAGQFAWLANITSAWYTLIGVAHTTSVNNANTLATQNNKPLVYGLESTTEANIVWSPSMDPITLDEGAAGLFTFVRCAQLSVKNTVAFVAASFSLPSSFQVNLYKVDFANNNLIFIGDNTGLQSELSGAQSWIEPSAFATSVDPGDTLAISFMVPTGTGGTSVTLYGIDATSNTTPARSTIPLPAIAATGPSSGTGDVPFSDLTFTNANVPYVGLEVIDPPPPVYPDFTTPYPIPGTHTHTIADWLQVGDLVDLIGVGGGGGGQGEQGVSVGIGGDPGVWNDTTLVVGTDIAVGGTITIVVPDLTDRAAYFTSGEINGPTTFTWTKPGVGTQTLTCAGGHGGGITAAGGPYGLGGGSQLTSAGAAANDHTYNSVTYPGGAATISGTGNTPGGGGLGAPAFQFGYEGAGGQGWTVERQA